MSEPEIAGGTPREEPADGTPRKKARSGEAAVDCTEAAAGAAATAVTDRPAGTVAAAGLTCVRQRHHAMEESFARQRRKDGSPYRWRTSAPYRACLPHLYDRRKKRNHCHRPRRRARRRALAAATTTATATATRPTASRKSNWHGREVRARDGAIFKCG